MPYLFGRKRPIILLVFFILAGSFQTYAVKVMTLTETMRPRGMLIAGDRLYIRENKSIQLYSLKKKQFIRFIGKYGRGPAEYDEAPVLYLRLPDKLYVHSMFKLMVFTPDGDYISERKFNRLYTRMEPVDDNYLVENTKYVGKGKTRFKDYHEHVYLFNKRFQEIKLLHDSISPSLFKEINVAPPYLGFRVYKDRIYMLTSGAEALSVDIYDKNGNKLESFQKNFEKIMVSEEYVKRRTTEYKEFTGKHWPEVKDLLTFPEYFPIVRSSFIKNDKIYIAIWGNGAESSKFLIMDLKGNIIKTVTLPAPLLGLFSLRTIANDTYYYLVENMEEEMFELHSVDLK